MFQNLFARINALIISMFAEKPQMIVIPARSRRGATFIEYALLAGVAVIVFFAFRGPLTNLMTGIINQVSRALGL
jgi:Flp pilus assembly pilin Flp